MERTWVNHLILLEAKTILDHVNLKELNHLPVEGLTVFRWLILKTLKWTDFVNFKNVTNIVIMSKKNPHFLKSFQTSLTLKTNQLSNLKISSKTSK